MRTYVALAGDKNVSLPAELGDALVLFHQIEKELKTDEPACLCHNDLLAGNFIDDGRTMHLIDWEYGGRGDRFFDLGNFAVNLQLSEEEEKTFLAGYFGEARAEHLRRLKLMRLASDLRESSWGFLQSALSTLHPAQYYLDYGNKHLRRFLAEAKRFEL